jgi:hypothetical protein
MASFQDIGLQKNLIISKPFLTLNHLSINDDCNDLVLKSTVLCHVVLE